MKRLLTGAVLAAVAMFFWGFLYWAVFPFTYRIMAKAPNEEALTKALSESLPASGLYLIPHPSNPEEVLAKRALSGPFVHVNIQKQGAPVTQGSVFLWGFVHMLACALLLGLVLQAARPSGFAGRFQMAALAGLAGAAYSNLGKPIWWHQTWDFHLLNFGFDLGSWLLAAVVLAWFLRE